MTHVIDKFSGEFDFLSNFFVEPDGTTVEHEFQAAKTNLLHEKLGIFLASTPGKAKRMGRKATLRTDWESCKILVMRELVFRKFLDHPGLARKLADTGVAPLIEGNNWHDNVWGICSCPSCNGTGTNHLGEILMEVRSLIQSYERN